MCDVLHGVLCQVPWLAFRFSTQGFAVSGTCVEDLVLCCAVGSVEFVGNGGFKQARGFPGQVSLLLVMACVICLVLWTCLLVWCFAWSDVSAALVRRLVQTVDDGASAVSGAFVACDARSGELVACDVMCDLSGF